MSGIRHAISYHVLNRKNTHTEPPPWSSLLIRSLRFVMLAIKMTDGSHLGNIKKCLSVEIKSFRTRTVTRNGGELLQYDSGDTTHN